MPPRPNHDPLATLSGVVRVAYSELVTVVAVSVLTAMSALSVVGLGAGIVASVTTMSEVVEDRRLGRRTSERERLARYREVFVDEFWRALPLGVLLSLAAATFVWYVLAASASADPWLLLAGVASVYAFTLVLVVLFRTATLLSIDPDVPFRRAVRDAGYHLLEAPSFSVLQATAVVGVAGLCVALLVATPLLLFGLLAVIEVLAYAERDGAGARDIVFAYQRGDVP